MRSSTAVQSVARVYSVVTSCAAAALDLRDYHLPWFVSLFN